MTAIESKYDAPRQSEHLTHPKYRADIDGLRAIAILSVVGYHVFPNWVKGGFIGVDIFFVISGYLISTIIFDNLERNSFSFVEFYSRRIKRIFPALLVVLAASFGFGWFALMPDEFKQLGKHIAGGAGFISNFVLWNESGYFDNAAETKPLLHLWSLGIEEQFYIFWPLLLAFVWKRNWSFLYITATIAIVSFAASIYLISKDPAAAFYLPIPRFWELMIGGLLAYIALHKPELNSKHKNTHSVIGFALVILALVLVNKEREFPGWWALLPALGTSFVISAGPRVWLNSKLLSSKILVWFGLISYPLYLWHWPLLTFAKNISYETPSILMRIAVVILSVVLAWITYQLIERKVRFGRQTKTITPALLLSMFLVLCVGYYCKKEDGFSSRFSSEIKAISQITNVYEYFNYKNLVRVGVCHSVPVSLTYANCIERRGKMIFLWGDSYAAALYSGLDYVRNKSEQNYGISQMTDGNGPPFFTDSNMRTDDGKTLIEANNNRLEAVRKYKPDVILITWYLNGGNSIRSKEDTLSALSITIQKIKQATPDSKIVIIGPVPEWKGNLVNVILNYWSLNKTVPPQYMRFGLLKSTKSWDDYFKVKIPALGANYVSAYDALCNDSGCLTRTGNNIEDISAVDWGHLTRLASIYLVEKMKKSIFLD